VGIIEQSELWPDDIGSEPRECVRCKTEFQTPRDPGTRPFGYKPFCPPCEESICFYGAMIQRASARQAEYKLHRPKRKRKTSEPEPQPKRSRKERARTASAPKVEAAEPEPDGEADAALEAAADSMMRGEKND
jgi:hypothetical protein